MKVEEVLACSFSSWYGLFKNITEESITIPLPDHFLEYLNTDGVVLPESSTHGIHKKASNLAMDGDEDDPEIRDDDLMNMYEADWSTPDSDTASSQTPEFGAFEDQVKNAIQLLGGRVFPKLNWSSPKDASWISFDKTLLCTCPCDVYLLLKSSQFVAHDLDMPFSGCEDQATAATSAIPYDLVLRKWNAPHPASEFRCFVRNKNIVGICQRNMEKYYASIAQEKDSIIDDIQTFFSKKIIGSFPSFNYVFDVVRLKKANVRLIDFNPWGPVTDSLMFEWDEIEAISSSPDTQQNEEFRCVMSEEGVKIASHAIYSLSQDLADLTSGEDPAKLIDLLKLNSMPT